MKNIKIIFILSLLLVSCGDKGGDKGGNWSAEMKATFMDSCVSEAILDIDESTARDYCDCCLVELQKIYDMQAMEKIELGETDENFAENFTAIVLECAGKFMEF